MLPSPWPTSVTSSSTSFERIKSVVYKIWNNVFWHRMTSRGDKVFIGLVHLTVALESSFRRPSLSRSNTKVCIGLVHLSVTLDISFRRPIISSCSVPNLYSDQYHFFVTLMIGTVSGIMILIVCVTVSTSRHIWRIFFTKLKVNPRDNEVSSLNVESIGRAKNKNSNCENDEQRTEVLSVTDKLMSWSSHKV
jgi:hypothetical protein